MNLPHLATLALAALAVSHDVPLLLVLALVWAAMDDE